MERTFFVLGALSAFLSVAAGAFGAHALEGRVPLERLDVFETGARYQMYHALALAAVALAAARWPDPLWNVAAWLFVAGTLLFSGSLYLLVLGDLRWMGAITPFGGLAFLAGWVVAAVAAARA